ncbi:hypoxanthine phosphoribosyltransferase [Spiroplasma endosymbiont of Labia minor]|uniref:hypoxanthine phosphoribosyltransferase n=1 Tax=Spiroplasma endosymbiont of Labia minor TaxID=3066305 RepID=UPI0030D56C2F
MKLHPLIKNVLYNFDQIEERTKELAKEISKYYDEQEDIQDNNVLLVGILKGCVPFMGVFLKYFDYNCETHYMVVSSYLGSTKSSGEPKILLDLNVSIKDKDILIVEDIIDSGITLKYVKEYLFFKGAKTVKIISFLDKKEGRKVELKPDWYCFDVKNEFVIGFGFDINEKLRNLPYVGVCDIEKLETWDWTLKKEDWDYS